jgi:hypothetical protein
MDGQKSVYLSNGDLLVLLEEQYYISYGGDTQPVGVEKEEGERLLFETCHQQNCALEALLEKKDELEEEINMLQNNIVHKYLPRIKELENALGK